MGKVAIFAGNFAKTLKQNLNLFDQAYILTGSIDPSAVATDGPPGSLFLRSNGSVYIKQDSGTTTNWTLNDTSANSFVQGGNSFGATAVLGTNDSNNLSFETGGTVRATFDTSGNLGIATAPVVGARLLVSGKLAVNDSSLGSTALDVSTSSAGSAMVIQSNATASGNSIFVVNSNSVTGSVNGFRLNLNTTGNAALLVDQSGTGSAVGQFQVVSGSGDPFIKLDSVGVQNWSIGQDQSDSAIFKIASGSTLGTSNDRVRITTGGLFGIGSATPVSLLHLSSSSAAAIESRYTNSSTGQTASDGFTVGISSGGVAQINQLENLDLTLATNNTVGFTLSNAQNASMLAEKTFSFGSNAALQDNIASNRLIIGGTYPNINFRTGGTLRAIITSTAEVGIGTSGTPTALFNVNGAYSRSSWTTNGAYFQVSAATVTDTTGSGTITTRNANSFGITTMASSSAVTLTNAVNLAASYPAAGANTTFTTAVALDIPTASVTATNAVGLRITAATTATNIYPFISASTTGFSGFGTASPTALLHAAGNMTVPTPSANVGAYKFLVTGGTLTSSDASGTVSAMATANITGASFAASSAGVTVTNGASLLFGTYPTQGTNVTLTNAHCIRIISSAITATNSYGLSVAAATGATNNYCAQFTGGNVGFRTSAPTAYVQIAAGTATAGTAPLKLTAGTNLTTPEAGAIEFDGTNLTYTNSGATRLTLLTTTTAPTQQRFTSGSGTYTTPANVRYIRVVAVGGGGGGGGSGVSGGTGGTGGNTTFGSSLLTANGGAGVYFTTGSGGTATISSPAFGTAITGASGTGTGQSSVAGAIIPGGMGGVSPLGGAGAGGVGSGATGSVGGAAVANTGSGGGGAGANNVGTGTAGSGGCAGGYLVAFIASPSASYSYAVGAAGSGGAAGTTGSAGGDGGSGYIEVTEFY